MNEKVQALLLKLILHLQKKYNWHADDGWRLTLKSEGYVPLSKHIRVQGDMDGKEWYDDIETGIVVSFQSDDQITFFPQAVIDATIHISGGGIQDLGQTEETKYLGYTIGVDVAFTEEDFSKDDKSAKAAKQIEDRVKDYIQEQYSEYINANYENIKSYKEGGWKADQDQDR